MSIVTRLIQVACRAVIAGFVIGALAGFGNCDAFAQSAQPLEIRILSSRPDLASGGDTFVEVKAPPDVSLGQIKLTLNGKDVTGQLKTNLETGSLRGQFFET